LRAVLFCHHNQSQLGKIVNTKTYMFCFNFGQNNFFLLQIMTFYFVRGIFLTKIFKIDNFLLRCTLPTPFLGFEEKKPIF